MDLEQSLFIEKADITNKQFSLNKCYDQTKLWEMNITKFQCSIKQNNGKNNTWFLSRKQQRQ